jgi:internalin A
VTGPVSSRRRLLAVIRSDLERIHADIKKLQVTEMVPVAGRPAAVVPYAKLRTYEKQGIRSFTDVFGDDVVELDVQTLLNGVDLEGARRGDADPAHRAAPLRLFISYAHQDETLRGELETHLKLLQRRGLIATWQDRKISPGTAWQEQIDRHLKSAEIILLLVSADFIASDYAYDLEMRRAMERHDAGAARVIPIIVRDVNWRTTPLAQLQALPTGGKAITLWDNKDSAWRNVSEGIERVIAEMAAPEKTPHLMSLTA